ncbi:MAG: acylphosphatase [Aggregatilineales bacterium]
MTAKMRLHTIVSGRVQGVSFRYYTVQAAEKLYLTGWVRNNRDRTVEVMAEGNRDNLEQFLAFLHEGSPHANVSDVQSTWHEATDEFAKFSVRYVADS